MKDKTIESNQDNLQSENKDEKTEENEIQIEKENKKQEYREKLNLHTALKDTKYKK